MDVTKAKAISIQLEELLACMEGPMDLASGSDDDKLKRMVGSLCGVIVGQIDYVIGPYLKENYGVESSLPLRIANAPRDRS